MVSLPEPLEKPFNVYKYMAVGTLLRRWIQEDIELLTGLIQVEGEDNLTIKVKDNSILRETLPGQYVVIAFNDPRNAEIIRKFRTLSTDFTEFVGIVREQLALLQ